MIMNICEIPEVLETLSLIRMFITIIKIVVPIILLVTVMVDFLKCIANEKEFEKIKKVTVNRILAAILIFLVPTMIGLVAQLVPDSGYGACFTNTNTEGVNRSYENRIEELIERVEESLSMSDYQLASSYLPKIKNEEKKEEYKSQLDEIYEKITEASEKPSEPENPGQPQNPSNPGNTDDLEEPETDNTDNYLASYEKVNYNNFKWTYYKAQTGPVSSEYSNCTPYAIYAPNDTSDLNNVSLPLIIWLHGLYESTYGEQSFLNSGLLKVVREWGSYDLKEIPAIIVASQSKTSPKNWKANDNYKTIRALVNYARSEYNIDSKNIVIMGHSMGGNGVINLSYLLRDLNFSAAVIMSSGISKSYDERIPYYTSLKMRGYSEDIESKEFFDWINKGDSFIHYKGTAHGDVPKKALTEDLNKNGVSDLIEWLFAN